MKTEVEIKVQIDILEQKLETEKTLYREMGQIDMLSSSGNQCRKFISKTEGQIKALNWVLGGF